MFRNATVVVQCCTRFQQHYPVKPHTLPVSTQCVWRTTGKGTKGRILRLNLDFLKFG